MAITDDIPKSRITLTYRTKVDGQPEDVTLPFRILVLGDLSNGTSKDRKLDLDQRNIRALNGKNLDAVMADMDMTLRMSVPNKINPESGESEIAVELPIKSMKSFAPAEISKNIPKVRALLLLKKLLLEAQANLDNRKDFRKLLRALATNKEAIEALRQQLPGFETFKLPPRPGKDAEGAANDEDRG